jgi:hypothetical protein
MKKRLKDTVAEQLEQAAIECSARASPANTNAFDIGKILPGSKSTCLLLTRAIAASNAERTPHDVDNPDYLLWALACSMLRNGEVK